MRLFHDGFLFSGSTWNVRTQRSSATLILSAGAADFQIEIGAHTRHAAVALVRPFVVKHFSAHNAPFVCIDISPNHPDYRAFNGVPGDGCLSLPRSAFATLAEPLAEFHAGRMEARHTCALYRDAMALATAHLPLPAPLDPRLQRALTMIHHDPCLPLQSLAATVCLSLDRLSHLFSRQMGISLRKYVQTMKIHAAARCFRTGMSLTAIAAEAGFSDSAHFAKVWQQAFGAAPGRFFREPALTVDPLTPEPWH